MNVYLKEVRLLNYNIKNYKLQFKINVGYKQKRFYKLMMIIYFCKKVGILFIYFYKKILIIFVYQVYINYKNKVDSK